MSELLGRPHSTVPGPLGSPHPDAAYDRRHRDMEQTFSEMVVFAFKWLLAFTIASIPFDLATFLIIRAIT